MDRGGQRSPTRQVLEAGHGGEAGGASSHSAVLAVPDLQVGAGSGQRSGWPPEQWSCRLGREAWGFRHKGA